MQDNLSKEIQGTIYHLGEVETFNSGFQKRLLVIKAVGNNPEFPQLISCDFIKDKISILDQYAVGQEVKVKLNIQGREWRSPSGELRYFNTLQAWRIESAGEAAQTPPSDTQDRSTILTSSDGLPF